MCSPLVTGSLATIRCASSWLSASKIAMPVLSGPGTDLYDQHAVGQMYITKWLWAGFQPPSSAPCQRESPEAECQDYS